MYYVPYVINHLFTTLNSFGVLLPQLVEEFKSTKSAVSWAGSLVPGLYMGYVHDFAYEYICTYTSLNKYKREQDCLQNVTKVHILGLDLLSGV